MNNGTLGRRWLPLAALGLLTSAACGGGNASPPMPLAGNAVVRPSVQRLTQHSICEKLIKGDPNVPVKVDCSGRKDQMLNAEVCDLPSGQCSGVPQSATVLVWEHHYSGALIGADKPQALPPKIRRELDGGGELCGDTSKTGSKNPEDIIHFSPSKGHTPSTKFKVTDEGRRTKNGSGSGTCHIVFYDANDRFVEFLVVML